MDSMADTQGESRRDLLQFRIAHLLYATAVIGAAVATCGLLGLVLAAVVLFGWCMVLDGYVAAFLREHRPRLLNVLIAVVRGP
jgi:hypothetical protein